MTVSPKQKKRLNREAWLELAMEALSKYGGARLNVNDLCRDVGVTKGSFYAHFKDRSDFVERFLDYWSVKFTENVTSATDALQDAPPERRLLKLMRVIHEEQLARYDVAVRAWAAQEEAVARGVAKVDRQRFEYVREIFREMGHRGADLEMRTRIFVVYHSLKEGMRLPPSDMDANREIRRLHAFFVDKP
ncbi:MAG: TetR/AcrR family transcriptional regulator [Hyphomicrobiaceae bacterium]